jgi:hypothetical protein
MRWRGLAKAGLQIRFTAIVYNIKRCSRILAAAKQQERPEHAQRTAGNTNPRTGLLDLYGLLGPGSFSLRFGKKFYSIGAAAFAALTSPRTLGSSQGSAAE